MTKSSDIANLFARFGGQPDSYQELSSQGSLSDARKRWPLLRAIDGEDEPAPAAEPVKTPPILKGKSVAPQRATPSVKTEPLAQRKRVSVDRERASDNEVQVPVRPVLARPEVQRQAAPVPRSVRQTAQPAQAARLQAVRAQPAQPVERPISEVFSKLAAKSRPEPEPEAPKSSGLFSSLRRVVRK